MQCCFDGEVDGEYDAVDFLGRGGVVVLMQKRRTEERVWRWRWTGSRQSDIWMAGACTLWLSSGFQGYMVIGKGAKGGTKAKVEKWESGIFDSRGMSTHSTDPYTTVPTQDYPRRQVHSYTTLRYVCTIINTTNYQHCDSIRT